MQKERCWCRFVFCYTLIDRRRFLSLQFIRWVTFPQNITLKKKKKREEKKRNLLALGALGCTQTASHLHSEKFTGCMLWACNHNVLLYRWVLWLEWLTQWVPMHYAPCRIMRIPDAGALPILAEANQKNRSHTAGCTAFDEALCTDHFLLTGNDPQ